MPKQPPALLVDGKPFTIDPYRTRAIARMQKFLDSLDDNQVVTMREFCRLSHIGQNSLYDNQGDQRLKDYVYATSGRKRIYFGNPRAIQKLKALYAAGNQ